MKHCLLNHSLIEESFEMSLSMETAQKIPLDILENLLMIYNGKMYHDHEDDEMVFSFSTPSDCAEFKYEHIEKLINEQ